MTGKVFVDTNIFLYAIDLTNTTKRNRALALLRRLVTEGSGVISSQVVNEFTSNVLGKFQRSPVDAKELYGLFAGFEFVPHSLATSLSGIDIVDLYRINYWDAILIAAARSAKCSVIYTEDLNHGQNIQGIKIVDPFA